MPQYWSYGKMLVGLSLGFAIGRPLVWAVSLIPVAAWVWTLLALTLITMIWSMFLAFASNGAWHRFCDMEDSLRHGFTAYRLKRAIRRS